MAAKQRQTLMSQLTREERRFVLQQRVVEVVCKMATSVVMPHWNSSYLELCGGDTGLMAFHYGKCALYVSSLEMFCSPLVASLSDQVGRKHLMTWGRLGWIIFFSGHRIRDRSLAHRALFEAVPWGIIQAGTWPVFSAAHSDVFGQRPELSARIKSADGFWMDLAGIAGPFIGVAVARLFGLAALEHFSSLLTLSSMAIQLTMSETLKPEDRKPFKFSTANPFSNLQLLFTNGAGLRRLTISTSLWFWCQEIWSTQSAFRMGVLRWSPVDQSYFDSLYNAAGAVSRRTFLDPVLKSLGNRSAFELGSLLSVLSYFIQSQSWRPLGATRARMAAQYCIGILILATLPATMGNSMRAMVVKQGLEVSNVGKGQLNAAYSGLGQITAVVSALWWGGLYRFFSGQSANTPRLLRWGPGGHFLVTSAMMLGAWAALRTADPSTLYVEERSARARAGSGDRARGKGKGGPSPGKHRLRDGPVPGNTPR